MFRRLRQGRQADQNQTIHAHYAPSRCPLDSPLALLEIFDCYKYQEYDMQETGNTGQRQRHCGKDKKYHQTYPSPTTICKSRESLGRPSRKRGMARNEHRKKACCRCNELGNSEIQLIVGRPATMVAWASSTQQEGLQRAELLVYHGGRRARPICGFRGRWT